MKTTEGGAMNMRVLSGLGAIGLNVADIVSNINSIAVFILSILTMVYIGYGIYKRHLECKNLKNHGK